jgi:hypothetical protein
MIWLQSVNRQVAWASGGTMLFNALLKGFDEYKKDKGSPPCVPAGEPAEEQKAGSSKRQVVGDGWSLLAGRTSQNAKCKRQKWEPVPLARKAGVVL